jgi:hypothetical protein
LTRLPYLRAAATSDQRVIVVAILSAAATILAAMFSALAAYLASKRQQRRTTYSEAVRAATAWKELLYRVRRRQEGQAPAIIDLFHRAQDDLSYFEAWVGAESKYMRRSYLRLVVAVKAATEEPIQQAWRDPVRPQPGDAQPGDVHPDLGEAVGAFLTDVRSHLSPWPWRKVAMVWRNRKGA